MAKVLQGQTTASSCYLIIQGGKKSTQSDRLALLFKKCTSNVWCFLYCWYIIIALPKKNLFLPVFPKFKQIKSESKMLLIFIKTFSREK